MAEQTKGIVGLGLSSRATINKSLRRDLQKGASRHTEHYAYQHVIPLSAGELTEERLLRIAALIAGSDVSHGDQSFGEWLQGKKSKNAENRLLAMMNLNFEQAISEIARLLKSVDNSGSFNWFDLADTLFFWGNGISDASLKTRQKLLRDYYRVPTQSASKDDSGSPEESDESND